MSLRLSEQELADLLKNRGKQHPMVSAIPEYNRKISNKMNAVICEADKIKFPSKKHRNHYLLLKAMQQSGEINFFLREVPFDLPGHYENGRVVRHFVDFMLCLPDGKVRWQEVKGRDLATGKLKRAQVEEIYKITIDII